VLLVFGLARTDGIVIDGKSGDLKAFAALFAADGAKLTDVGRAFTAGRELSTPERFVATSSDGSPIVASRVVISVGVGFLLGGGALVVGFSLSACVSSDTNRKSRTKALRVPKAGPPDAKQVDTWLAIHSDNTATLYTGIVHLSSTDSAATLPANATLSNGVGTFALVYMTDARHWPAATAGRLLASAQFCGVAARLGAGWWSDRVGSRMRPMRTLAICTAISMVALAVTAATGSVAAVPVLLACGVVGLSTNGLAFTAVAEFAGSAWAGRALGVQNTGQNALAAATPPVLALTIGSLGFGASFAIVAAFPLVAALLVPVAAERAALASQPAA
jgi:hypothetical protein